MELKGYLRHRDQGRVFFPLVTEQEKGRAPYGGAEHGGRCGLPPATGAVKWITRAEWGGGLQVHGELVTWAQNREDNWTSQSDSTNGATEHRQRQRRGGRGGVEAREPCAQH